MTEIIIPEGGKKLFADKSRDLSGTDRGSICSDACGGHITDLFKSFERFMHIPLSLRSNSGEVVCKTDYFYGPCSFIRNTPRGRIRCRRTYKNIEDRLLRRKTPFVNVCYAGFLIFAAPLEFRGEMIGTLLGSQILPVEMKGIDDLKAFFDHIVTALDLSRSESFFESFKTVRYLRPDFERIAFMEFLRKIADNFMRLAMAETTWPMISKELHRELKTWGWESY